MEVADQTSMEWETAGIPDAEQKKRRKPLLRLPIRSYKEIKPLSFGQFLDHSTHEGERGKEISEMVRPWKTQSVESFRRVCYVPRKEARDWRRSLGREEVDFRETED